MKTQSSVGLYARVSTPEQSEKGYSIEAQIHTMKDYAHKQGLNIYKVYVDKGRSASTTEHREGLHQLLHDIQQGHIQSIIIWKLNRLARNTKDLLGILSILKEHKVNIHSVSERVFQDMPLDTFYIHILSAISELELTTIKDNSKIGILKRMHKGKFWGPPPLGYDLVIDTHSTSTRNKKVLQINSIEANTIRYIYNLYSEENKGYKAIVNQLNREGYRTKKGCLFSIGGIRSILTNVLYIGKIRFMDNGEEKIINAIHPPIIDQKQFDKVQQLIHSKGRAKKIMNRPHNILAKILKCPQCRSGMVPTHVKSRRKDGSYRINYYYTCGAYLNKGNSVCKANSVRADIEDQVFNYLHTLLNQPSLLKDILLSIQQKHVDKASAKQHLNQLEEQRSKGKEERKRLLIAFENGSISENKLTDQLRKLNDHMVLLEEKIASILEEMFQAKDLNIKIKQISHILKQVLHSQKESDLLDRKKLVQTLIHSIHLDEHKNINKIELTWKTENPSQDHQITLPISTKIKEAIQE